MKRIFPFVLIAALPVTAYSKTELPLGATDLVPDQRLEKLKEKKIETVSFKLKLKEIEWEQEEIGASSVFHVDYPTELMKLKIENGELKQKLSEMEQRLSKLEALLSPRSKPGASGNG